MSEDKRRIVEQAIAELQLDAGASSGSLYADDGAGEGGAEGGAGAGAPAAVRARASLRRVENPHITVLPLQASPLSTAETCGCFYVTAGEDCGYGLHTRRRCGGVRPPGDPKGDAGARLAHPERAGGASAAAL